MYSIDLLVAEATMTRHARTAWRPDQQRRLLRQAKERRQGWACRQRCRFVHHLGHNLVALGEWLEAFGSPQPSYQR